MNKDRVFRFIRSFLLISFVIVMAVMPVSPGVAQDQNSTSATTSLVEHVLGSINTLDPALAYDSSSIHVIYQVYDTLLFYNREKTDEFIPMLASNWTISPDGLTYVFNIRHGVEFHNGNSLTPSDVAYTFQRGLLQGGYSSPQGLLAEAFLGYGNDDITMIVDGGASADDRGSLQAADPAALLAACQTVKNAIVADDSAWTVTMTLAQPWNPLLVTLSGTWGAIMDKEWSIANGGWDDSCLTWQNYYAPDYSSDPFTAIENGSGPFYMDSWDFGTGGDISLLRNENYWRQELDPLWFGVPGGPAYFEDVLIEVEPELGTRLAAFISGASDFSTNLETNYVTLDGLTLFNYPEPDGLTPELVHSGGYLKRYERINNSADMVLFVYDIDPASAYIGTGALGTGIPHDFFSDVNVRRAFSYAFDYDQFITDVYGGDAIRLRGPIPAGIMGYSETSSVYTHDHDAAIAAMELAWGGEIDSFGFEFTIPYNAGNTSRKAYAERIQADMLQLNPKYIINVVEIEWPVYLAAQRNYQLPITTGGWTGDIPHPYNWVNPYMIGSYAHRQRIPEATMDSYEAMIVNCMAQSGSAAVTCYEGLQSTAVADAISIFPAQAKGRDRTNVQVRGYYDQPYQHGAYFYSLYKNSIPSISPLTPSSGISVGFNTAGGSSDQVDIVAGAVSHSYDIAVTSDTRVTHFPIGTRPIRLGFDIQAFQSGVLVDGLNLSIPAMVTLSYGNADVIGLVEDQLMLFYWGGSSWEDASCGTIIRDTTANTLQVPICHLSHFAMGSEVSINFLPLLKK